MNVSQEAIDAEVRDLISSLPLVSRPADLAEALGVSQRTLRNWRAKKILVARRTGPQGGGPALYPRENVEALLSAGYVPPSVMSRLTAAS